MSVASYLELRSALIEIARGRLEQAAVQMAGVFDMSARQRLAAMRQLMALPEIRDYVRTGDASRKPAIEAAVKTYLGPAIEFADVELWDANAKRIFAVGGVFEEVTGAQLDEYQNDLPLADDASIGRLRMFEDGLRYPVGGRLTQDGRLIGYIVERRRISNPTQTRQTVALLTGLIGNAATMVMGNADGSTWSDLDHRDQRPADLRQREPSLGLSTRRHAAHARLGHADCRHAVGGGDRIPGCGGARTVAPLRHPLAGDRRRGVAVGDHRRLGQHARHHHVAASRHRRRRGGGGIAAARARRHGRARTRSAGSPTRSM